MVPFPLLRSACRTAGGVPIRYACLLAAFREWHSQELLQVLHHPSSSAMDSAEESLRLQLFESNQLYSDEGAHLSL